MENRGAVWEYPDPPLLEKYVSAMLNQMKGCVE